MALPNQAVAEEAAAAQSRAAELEAALGQAQERAGESNAELGGLNRRLLAAGEAGQGLTAQLAAKTAELESCAKVRAALIPQEHTMTVHASLHCPWTCRGRFLLLGTHTEKVVGAYGSKATFPACAGLAGRAAAHGGARRATGRSRGARV